MVKLEWNREALKQKMKFCPDKENSIRWKPEKQRTKPPEKVFRSMEEIRKHFFPNFYEEEERRNRTPETAALGLTRDILETDPTQTS